MNDRRNTSRIIALAGALMIVCMASVGMADEGSASSKKSTAVAFKSKKPVSRDGVSFRGADEGEYLKMQDSDDGMLVLQGHIIMEADGRTIRCDRVEYNRATGDVTIPGPAIMEDGSVRIKAEKCVYNVKDRAGVLYRTASDTEPIFFSSDSVKIVGRKKYVAQKTQMTGCEYARPHYHFRVSRVWIYTDKRVFAHNAIYVVGDMPLFYLPVVMHSDEGFGIVTQFGRSDRRGNFIQNTLTYRDEDKNRWRYKLDFYEKMGTYGGFEFNRTAAGLMLDIYLAGAQYKYVNADLQNASAIPSENWYKARIKSAMDFFKRDKANAFSSLDFEWMNNWDFERSFDNRREPRTTAQMISWVPSDMIPDKRTLNWIWSIGDRGERYSATLTLGRVWYWDDRYRKDEVKNYGMQGLYMPQSDTLPSFSFNYNGSFSLFGSQEKSAVKNGQLFNWSLHLEERSTTDYIRKDIAATDGSTSWEKNTNWYSGYASINTVIPFLTYFSYTPGLQLGFQAERIDVTREANRELNAAEARKQSFEYVETSHILRFGLPLYYLQTSYNYRRSFLEEQVVEPFVHEKLSYFQGGLYLFPADGISMSVTSGYDARTRYPFEDERLSNIEVKNTFFFDFYNYWRGDSLNQKKKGLFFTGITLTNSFLYISKEGDPGTNTLDVAWTTGNFALPGLRLVRSIEIGYSWFHDYRFAFRDMMSIRLNAEIDITRLWRLQFGGTSQADRAYLLYDSRQHNSFYNEFQKSVYFYDSDKSKNPVFTLRHFYADLFHDLHCWEMGLSYHIDRISQPVGTGNVDRLVFYEKRVFITLRLKSFAGIGIEQMQIMGSGKERQY